MKICARCLYTSHHPLHLTFDDYGICSGCRVHEEKDSLDWKERAQKLELILSNYRSKSGRNYDCIIPVSGGRDSYYVVHTVKNVFGMNPLLVTYNKQYNTAAGVRNLANLRIQFDCDIMTLTVNPETVKKITRSTLRQLGSMYWHCLAGQTVFPVQIATRFKIPLIVWGVHQGTDQVGMFSHLDEVEMTRRYRKEHDLMRYEAEDLINEIDNISKEDILPFVYPDNKELEQVGVRGIYLNNYIRWDSRVQHEEMIRTYSYETLSQNRTFDSFNDVDCWAYSDVHDYIKWIKHGYGKVVDHASREIRLRRMTREYAISLTGKYINRKPIYLKMFLEWLGITEDAFHYVVDQHRNPEIWYRDENWRWQLQHDYEQILRESGRSTAAQEQLSEFNDFVITPTGESSDPDGRYILIGKGHG
jgi:N-acetyl sugar amidotransferase